ncbi:YncE family protein [Ideonella sp.]|uniref:YncE family protein n=1 Tax=Ideonella sp. TaxID=1929293 RepID=UPI0035B32E6E
MNWMKRLLALAWLSVLAACGGGGSGSDPSDGSWLSFTPSALQVSLLEGTSSTLTVQAHSSRTIAQDLYVKIVDPAGVTTGVFVVEMGQTDHDYTVQMEVSPELAPGVHQGEFEVTLYTDPGFTQRFESAVWQVPYTITVNARRTVHRLLSDRQAVGLAAFPNAALSRLEATVRITDNLARATSWTATSDRPWLSATASGTTGDGSGLVLVADPASLPADTISYATVTLSSSDPTVVNQESIRVAVWKGATNPSSHTGGARRYTHAITDRAAPLVYAHDGSAIDVVNAYTGAVLATLTPAAGADLGEMATSSDGTRLYAVNATSRAIEVFDLASRTRLQPWALDDGYRHDMGIQFIRPNGVGVLLSSTTAFLAGTGERIRTDLGLAVHRMVASDDGSALYGVNSGISPLSAYKWAVDYVDANDLGLELVAQGELGDYDSHGFRPFLALSPDGRKLYVGAARIDTGTFTSEAFLPYYDQGDLGNSIDSIAVGRDGRLYANYGTEFNVFASTGVLARRVVPGGVVAGATATADGVLAGYIEYSGSGLLRFNRW